ncbi:MAG: hypothetical protein IBJ03_10715 [Gemmatimonadaceae bacterium]|nr:hypothetical protein [Gemmatimonadaceae bacterium]
MNELQAELSSPALVFEAAVAACIRDDWDAVASLCDPDSLIVHQHNAIKPYLPGAKGPAFSVEAFMQGPYALSREEAESRVEQLCMSQAPESRLRQDFPTVANVDELRSMSPERFYAAYIRGRSFGEMVIRETGNRHLTAEQDAAIARIARAFFNYRTIGVVTDGTSEGALFAYVLFRDLGNRQQGADGEPDWKAELPPEVQSYARECENHGSAQVVICRQQANGTWRLIAPLEFLDQSMAIVIDDPPAQGDIAGPLPE